jgi:hypothetical protein
LREVFARGSITARESHHRVEHDRECVVVERLEPATGRDRVPPLFDRIDLHTPIVEHGAVFPSRCSNEPSGFESIDVVGERRTTRKRRR